MQGEDVPNERRQAEDRRLPVERQGQPEPTQWIPEWNVSVMDLYPGLIRPRNDLGDLIPAHRVANGDARYTGQARSGQDVVGPKREAVMKGRKKGQHGRTDDPCETYDVMKGTSLPHVTAHFRPHAA